MFGITRQEKSSAIDEAMTRLLDEMNTYGPDSPEYTKMIGHLAELQEMKTQNLRRRVSPDTLAIVAGNLAAVLIVVGYERAHVVTTKALSFTQKP